MVKTATIMAMLVLNGVSFGLLIFDCERGGGGVGGFNGVIMSPLMSANKGLKQIEKIEARKMNKIDGALLKAPMCPPGDGGKLETLGPEKEVFFPARFCGMGLDKNTKKTRQRLLTHLVEISLKYSQLPSLKLPSEMETDPSEITDEPYQQPNSLNLICSL